MKEIKRVNKYYIVIAVVIAIIILIYLLGVVFFNSHFLPNTYAGPVNVSQLTSENALEKVDTEIKNQPLYFEENNHDIGYVTLEDIDASAYPEEEISISLDSQNSWLWPVEAFNREYIDISDSIELDTAVVTNLIPSLGVDNGDREATVNALIQKGENGNFTIKEEIYGQQISTESLTGAIESSIGKGGQVLPLEEAYIQPSEITESDSIEARLEQIKLMRNSSITLELPDNLVTIPEEKIVEWITIDDNNEIQLDKELIEEYLYSLNEQYAGLFQPRWFESSYQGTVQVQPGTYGWYIDRYEESDQIIADIMSGVQITRQPVIGGSGYGMGDYVGDDYVEVDIAHQMMFIYRDGQLVFDSPIVSGIIGSETIPGAYQVWNKEQNTQLTGYNTITQQDYVQPVSYWIAFDDQLQGIHDASWQSNFGGNAYMTAGSLGCINTPPGVMGQVYELVDYGMPVIIF